MRPRERHLQHQDKWRPWSSAVPLPDIVLKTDEKKICRHSTFPIQVLLPSLVHILIRKYILFHFSSFYWIIRSMGGHSHQQLSFLEGWCCLKKDSHGSCSRWPQRPLEIFSFLTNSCFTICKKGGNICLWPPRKMIWVKI